MSDAPAAHAYALRLAEALHAKHFADNVGWEPLPDLVGLLSQIDNMTAGLVHTAALSAARAEGRREGLLEAQRIAWESEDVYGARDMQAMAKCARNIGVAIAAALEVSP